MKELTRRDRQGAQLSQTTYGYDALGRQATQTDGRNGTTTYTFTADDQVESVTTPGPDGGAAGAQVTRFEYNALGQRVGWTGAVFGAVKFNDKTLPKSYHFFTGTLPEFNRQDLPGDELAKAEGLS